MKTNIISVIFIILIRNVVSNKILVEVEQGWLEGKRQDLVTGHGHYYYFKGVPYAAPPIGKLRFKSPRQPLPWQGIRKATKHGSICPQIELISNQVICGDHHRANEDCLFANIYTPNLTPCTPLAVLVFIHGGGYESGSGNDDFFGSDFLMGKHVVLVTFNYRLHALGFLCLGTPDVPGNAGLKDHVALLKWVQANIEQFGGDPNNVTIMGQGAGAASVGYHLTSPMSKGLFRRAIATSGSPYCSWSTAFQPVRRASVLGKLLGCETQKPKELLQCLQNVSVADLLNASPFITTSEKMTHNKFVLYQFIPVFEKYDGPDSFMTKNTFGKLGSLNKADILFGYTDQELLIGINLIVDTLLKRYDRYPENLVPSKMRYNYPPEVVLAVSDKIRDYYFGNKTIDICTLKEFLRYGNYATFIYDVIRYYATLPSLGNTKKYLYRFSSYSNRNIYGMQGEEYGVTGAAHLDGLLYLFDPKSLNLTLDTKSREFKLIEQYTTLITNFAKYGNPTPNACFNVTWPVFHYSTKKYVDIGDRLNVYSLNDDKDLEFWTNCWNYVEN